MIWERVSYCCLHTDSHLLGEACLELDLENLPALSPAHQWAIISPTNKTLTYFQTDSETQIVFSQVYPCLPPHGCGNPQSDFWIPRNIISLIFANTDTDNIPWTSHQRDSLSLLGLQRNTGTQYPWLPSLVSTPFLSHTTSRQTWKYFACLVETPGGLATSSTAWRTLWLPVPEHS